MKSCIDRGGVAGKRSKAANQGAAQGAPVPHINNGPSSCCGILHWPSPTNSWLGSCLHYGLRGPRECDPISTPLTAGIIVGVDIDAIPLQPIIVAMLIRGCRLPNHVVV
jgi:hypothetical protein